MQGIIDTEEQEHWGSNLAANDEPFQNKLAYSLQFLRPVSLKFGKSQTFLTISMYPVWKQKCDKTETIQKGGIFLL